MGSLEYFSDKSGLKQHLEYALHNVINNQAPSSKSASKVEQKNNTSASRWFRMRTKSKPAPSKADAKKESMRKNIINDGK